MAHAIAPSGNSEKLTCIVSVGRPHPALEVGIINPEDDNGDFLADGKVGELVLKTSSAMSEYLSEPEATRRAFHGQWLRTGDLAYLRNGEVFWTGRMREQIVIRGRKIDPSEFETLIARVPELRIGSFVAFGVDDGQSGTQSLVLICELEESVSTPYSAVAEDLQERLLIDFGVVASELILVQKGSLTKTSSGKRSNRYYREQYLTGKIPSLYTTRMTAIKSDE
jgi:acyl-CoA synthetase (AMP-forming)/AMP-acid ligase II